MQADQALLGDERAEERRCRRIGGDTRWHDDAGAAAYACRTNEKLGEKAVSVDVAAAGQRKSSTFLSWHASKYGRGFRLYVSLSRTPRISALTCAVRRSLQAEYQPTTLGGVGAAATSGARAAKNSCSCSLIRSHGGLPNTTSKPPAAIISGNSSGQWKASAVRARSTARPSRGGYIWPPVARCHTAPVVGTGSHCPHRFQPAWARERPLCKGRTPRAVRRRLDRPATPRTVSA